MASPYTPQVLQDHLDALCPELQAVVVDAIATGNPVVETWRGFGQAVRLRSPRPVLTATAPSLEAALRYRPVNDFHYWLGEIHCVHHPEWCIVLPYAAPDDDRLPGLGLSPLQTDT